MLKALVRAPVGALLLFATFWSGCGASPSPAGDDLVAPWRRVGTSREHTCALDDANRVFCWGRAGRDAVTVPTAAVIADRFVELDVGDWTACGTDDAGAVACWPLARDNDLIATPVVSSGVVQVGVGWGGGCARTRNGDLECWRDSLAMSSLGRVLSRHIVAIDVVDFVVQGPFVCATSSQGQRRAWRLTPDYAEIPPWGLVCREGQLSGNIFGWCSLASDGLTCSNRAGARLVYAATDLEEVGLGRVPCIRDARGRVACMGAIGCAPDRPCHGGPIDGDFVQVALPHRAVSLSVGGTHACALLVNGSIWCWGSNEHGELGAPGVRYSETPLEVRHPAN